MGIALEKDLVGMWSPQRSSWRCRAARATAPNRASGRGHHRGGVGLSCTWAATAASRPRWPSSSSRCRRRTRCWSTPARSCSSIGRKPSTNERTVHYLARVGLEHARRQVVEDPKPQVLYARGCASPCPSSPIPARENCGRARRARVRDPFPHERRHDNRHHHAKLVRDLPGRGHSTAGRPHRAPSRPRGHRRVPQPWRRGVRPDRPLPHKGGPLSAGLVHGRSVTRPCTTGWSTWTAARRRRLTWAAPGGRCPVEAGGLDLD